MAALRSLMIELGLADGVSNYLRSINSQIDGMQSGLVDTQCGFDDLGHVTKEYGRVAESEIAGVGKDITELDRQVEQSADVTTKATGDMAKSWGKVGAAIGAAALAGEAFVRSQQDHYFTADKIGFLTDLDKQEVVGLASELTNISNSIDDAYGVMEVGARQGLRTRDELAAYVRVWDDIGTASGEGAVELAEAAISLRSVGIDAGNLAESYDTLGFVMSHTNSSVSEFLRLTGYMARDMDQYGMEISDVAVTLAALEEKGMGAADAKRSLRSAMSAAKGDTTSLYRELGITDEQLTRLNDEVKGGADYIAAMGDAYNESQTPLQYLQVEVTKISNLIGADLNPVIGAGSMALSGLSSALLMGASVAYIFSVAATTALLPSLAASTAAAWAFTTALMANPITWMVLGIVGLGAALYLLASNWDTVSGWFMDRWDATAGVVTGAMDWIGGAWDSTVGSIIAGAEWLGDKLQYLMLLNPFTAPIAGMHLLRDNWDTVTGAIAGGWDWLVGAAQDGAAWLGETIDGGLSGITDLFWQYHPIGILVRQWDEITSYLQSIDLFETGKDILLGLVDGILDIRQQAIDAVMGIGEDILDAVTGFFGISSPSRLMQEMGAAVGEGFALGVDGSMPDQIILPDAIAGEVRLGTVPGGYVAAWTEPAVSSLAGEAVYSSALTEPVVGDLAGRAIYSSVLTEPVVEGLAGRVAYSSTLTEPMVGDLAGRAVYSSVLTEPAVGDLAGRATYSSTLTEPVVGDLVGRAIYSSALAEPMVGDLAGRAVYSSTLTEPVVEDLAGRAVYSSTLTEPVVEDLAGNVAYSSVLTEPVVGDLTGRAIYSSTLTEPMVGDLAGRVAYSSTLTEPVVEDLTGAITYLATVMEPMIPALSGIVEFRGMVGVPALEDMEPYGLPEAAAPRIHYTPERDAPMMAGSTATSYAPSTTINVTTGSGDAREIATVVDRRLRQTFDRHAETYFARQRRRAAL